MIKLPGVFLDAGSLDCGDIDWSSLERLLVPFQRFAHSRPSQSPERAAGARVLLVNKQPLDAELLASLTELRLICVAATGVDNVDLAAASRLGISVCNARDYATAAVAQHTWMLILSLATASHDYVRRVRNGEWSAASQFCLFDGPITELAGKTLGIVGYGRLGRAVAAIAPAFGVEPMIAERRGQPPRPGRSEFEAVLARADIISLHCPLSEDTQRLFDAPTLSRVRPGAWLVNTARGALIDESALASALRGGRLGGAALDVLSSEPPPPDHPLLAGDIPNLIVTPHCAWASGAARQRVVNQLAAVIRDFAAGEPLNLVNRPSQASHPRG